MIINCFYDENMDYADVVFIPDSINNIEELQNSFMKWLFDKNNNHKYWIIIEGEKKACRYGTQAFVDWINDTILLLENDRAYIIKENSIEWDKYNVNILF